MKYFSRIALVAALALGAVTSSFAQTMVRMHTTLGPLDIRLLDSEAPVSVANFLAYVRGGDYSNSFIHRSAYISAGVPFVIQGGGYTIPPGSNTIFTVPSRGAIVNEFSATRSNLRGTVAMAKLGNQPNSATNQWFVNMSNNAAILDGQNGGFTVFARVTAPGMVTADKISALPRYVVIPGANSAFTEVPAHDVPQGTTPVRENLIFLNSVNELPAPVNASDRIFNYAESAYYGYVMDTPTSAGEALGYQFRYYAATNSYVGTKDGHVWFYAPGILGQTFLDLGSIEYWTQVATDAGY